MKFGKFLLLYLITIFSIFGAVAVSGVDAQVSSDISVNIVPPNPAPYENVSITLNSFADNLDIVLISWSVNGKVVTSGMGKKSFSTSAPAAGGQTNVVATINLPTGVIQTNIPLQASEMILLTEAVDSYVPPFYKGKALPTEDSTVKVVAMPEIKTSNGPIDSNKMNYTWQQDYTNNVAGSGYGKNFFIYTSDYLETSNNVRVMASTLDQRYSSQGSIDIGTNQPKVLFYKNDNALGTLFNTALTGTEKIQDKEILEAIPYFISPKDLQSPALTWNWSINNGSVGLTNTKKNLMPLQVTDGAHGTSKVRLDLTNNTKIFLTASKEINIEF